MAFWSDETWRTYKDGPVPVEPFDPDNLEEAKYVMAVGAEVYLSSSAQGGTVQKLSNEDSFSIGPGQFAYIITHEIVRMPPKAIGFISINATIKFSGLVNISGFHVDPGYNGRIVFSVFNAGPVPIPLRNGDRIFPLWVADLDQPTKNPVRTGYMKIDSKLIKLIAGNYTTAYELNAIIKTLRDEYNVTKLEVAGLQAIKLQAIVVLAVLAFLFGGVVTAGSKMVFDWVAAGRAPIVDSRSSLLPQGTAASALPVTPTVTPPSAPLPTPAPTPAPPTATPAPASQPPKVGP